MKETRNTFLAYLLMKPYVNPVSTISTVQFGSGSYALFCIFTVKSCEW